MLLATQANDVIRRNIRRLREESGKTKSELCRSALMARSFWDEVEAGVKECKVSTLARIATVLGVTPLDLLTPHNGNGHSKSKRVKSR